MGLEAVGDSARGDGKGIRDYHGVAGAGLPNPLPKRATARLHSATAQTPLSITVQIPRRRLGAVPARSTVRCGSNEATASDYLPYGPFLFGVRYR